FLKHPKSFLLVHHPNYSYEGINDEVYSGTVINTVFVKKFFAGEFNNKELFKMLNNKEDISVIYPNPLKLTEDFCNAQKNFCSLIENNQIVREILDGKATLKDYYEYEGVESLNSIKK